MASRESQYTRLDKIEAGRDATIISGLIAPWVNTRISNEVQLMVADFRSQLMTHDMMVGRIAGIAMLLTLMSELENIQVQASTAVEKEMSNAKGQEKPN